MKRLGTNSYMRGKFYLVPVVKNEMKKCVDASDIWRGLVMQLITHSKVTVGEYSDVLEKGPVQRE